MLDKFRNRVDEVLEPIAAKFGREANRISYASLIFALIAAISFYYSYWHHYLLFISSISVILNGFLDAIDGKIARMSKKAGKKGDFIDHTIDRFSDALIIGSIAISPWCDKKIGVVAIAIVLLVSYMGTQAQAVGYKRVYSGVLGRADRLAILFFAPIFQYFIQRIYGYYLIEWVMVYFILAGIATITQRFYLVTKWLGEIEKREK
ncbi:MAG: CDP-alcohol phosphatidyltransferase family protein [Thermoplasmata archaeon]|nr:CDP-alcohol phosphatidyltransferase family protein [Thermoplasmata archaeon]